MTLARDLPSPAPTCQGAPNGERLYAEHAAVVRRYLRVLGASGHELDDLVQETFLVVLQRPFEDRGGPAVATFLRSTARFLFLRRHRGALPQVEAADVVWQRRCADDGGDAYLEALRDCVAALPERSQQLVELNYTDELGRAAIAARLGLRADGVKTALRRLRQALRRCVEQRVARERRREP